MAVRYRIGVSLGQMSTLLDISPERVLRRVGLSDTFAGDKEISVGPETFFRLWGAACAEVNRPGLRRLKEEATNYQELLNDARLEMSRRYLRTSGLNVPEISYLLGFRQTSSFFRALHDFSEIFYQRRPARLCD